MTEEAFIQDKSSSQWQDQMRAGANCQKFEAQIEGEKMEAYTGNTSLPFKLGNNKQVAIKIIDDRGIESLRIIKVKE